MRRFLGNLGAQGMLFIAVSSLWLVATGIHVEAEEVEFVLADETLDALEGLSLIAKMVDGEVEKETVMVPLPLEGQTVLVEVESFDFLRDDFKAEVTTQNGREKLPIRFHGFRGKIEGSEDSYRLLMSRNLSSGHRSLQGYAMHEGNHYRIKSGGQESEHYTMFSVSEREALEALGKCGVEHEDVVGAVAAAHQQEEVHWTERENFIEIEVAVDSDYSYQSGHVLDSGISDAIIAIHGASDYVYLKHGVTLQVVYAHGWLVEDIAAADTHARDIILKFSDYWKNRLSELGNPDLVHIFTRKELANGLEGIAFTGGVCDRRDKFGLSSAFTRVPHLVAAHEIGHNLGARHRLNCKYIEGCVQDGCMTDRTGDHVHRWSLMCPVLKNGGDNVQFAGEALGQIAAHLATVDCIGVTTDPHGSRGEPIPTIVTDSSPNPLPTPILPPTPLPTPPEEENPSEDDSPEDDSWDVSTPTPVVTPPKREPPTPEETPSGDPEENPTPNPEDTPEPRVDANRTHALWNGFLDMVNIVELVSGNTTRQSVSINLVSSDGVVTRELDQTLQGLEQRDVILNSITGFQKDAYGLLEINQASSSRVMYYRPNAEGYDFAFGIPTLTPLQVESYVGFNTFNPTGVTGAPVVNFLSLVNLGVRKKFEVQKLSGSGLLLSKQTYDLESMQRIDIEAGHVVPGANQVGLMRIVPIGDDAEYLAQLVRYGVTNSGYDFAFPLLAKEAEGERLHVGVDGSGGLQNWLELINVGSSAVNISLEIFGEDGTKLLERSLILPAFAQEHVDATRVLGERYGFARITKGGVGKILANSMFYKKGSSANSIAAVYGLQAESLEERDRLVGSFNTFIQMKNKVRVVNVSDENMIVDVSVQSLSSERNYEFPIELPPRTSIQDIVNYFGEDIYGTYVVTPRSRTNALVGYVLRERTGNRGDVEFIAPLEMN